MNSSNDIRATRNARPASAALVIAAAITCGAMAVSSAAQAHGRPFGPMANSNAPFVTWYQGFNHDASGWYGSATSGPLGWCGEIEAVQARGGHAVDPSPSAGSGYATLTNGLCNPFWTGLGVPFGAPYAPGPDQALYSSEWPESGYVTELDIWLDPSWSGEYQGSFEFAGSSPDTLIQYVATIFPTDPDAEPFHTGPHYFVNVDAVPGEEALVVAEHVVEQAGWYSFRFLFSDEGGQARVDFELSEAQGAILATLDALQPIDLVGPFKFPYESELPTSEYGSGHVWFFDIAFGLDLPIDEHRVRRGR